MSDIRLWTFGTKRATSVYGGKGTHLANTAVWGDRGAAEPLASAIGRDADIAVLTPGI